MLIMHSATARLPTPRQSVAALAAQLAAVMAEATSEVDLLAVTEQRPATSVADRTTLRATVRLRL